MNKEKFNNYYSSFISYSSIYGKNTFIISGEMNRLDAYTLFVLLRSVAIVGIAYVAYLSFAQNKKGWAWLFMRCGIVVTCLPCWRFGCFNSYVVKHHTFSMLVVSILVCGWIMKNGKIVKFK